MPGGRTVVRRTDAGLTYANPTDIVLASLQAELLL
jgi:hypothetical protein